MRRGLTLIELLVMLAIFFTILFMLSICVLPVLVQPTEVGGLVENKYTALNEEGSRYYRVLIRKNNGEADEYDSYWVHDKIAQGQAYGFKARGNSLIEVLARLPTKEEK